MKTVIALFILFLLSGCSTALLNPTGTVKATYDPTTGKIEYENNKDTNLEFTKDGDKITLKIQTDAASGIEARNNAAAAQSGVMGKLIDLIPK